MKSLFFSLLLLKTDGMADGSLALSTLIYPLFFPRLPSSAYVISRA